MKENEAFKKMALLMDAVQTSDALEELKSSAFEVLLLHPGSTYKEWSIILAEQYFNELMDAYGKDLDKITSSITALWKERYHDSNSGLEYTFEDWAKALSTEQAVQMYYDLTEKKLSKTKRF